MSWTYNGAPFADPQTRQSLIDSVRFLVGDTNVNDQQLQDTEITGLLALNSSDPRTQASFPIASVTYSPYQAAIAACLTLSAQYSRAAGSKSTGDLSISKGNIAQAYAALAKQLRAQAIRYDSPVPYAGGISKGDMETDADDDDMVQPEFSIGMDDNPDTSISITGGNAGFSQAVPAG